MLCVCVLDYRHCLLFRRSPDFSRLCTRVFDRQDKFNMNFDDFIQCCVMIRMLTDAFKKKDVQQRGLIQIHYEEVLLNVMWSVVLIFNPYALCSATVINFH